MRKFSIYIYIFFHQFDQERKNSLIKIYVSCRSQRFDFVNWVKNSIWSLRWLECFFCQIIVITDFIIFYMKTVALWLRNTDYKKKHPLCLLGLQFEASRFKVKLFHRKTVHEILWGYTDPFLEFLKHPVGSCPGQKGLSSYVQLQVGNLEWSIPEAQSKFCKEFLRWFW